MATTQNFDKPVHEFLFLSSRTQEIAAQYGESAYQKLNENKCKQVVWKENKEC